VSEVTTLGELAHQRRVILNDGYRTRADELGVPGVPILRVAEVQDGFIAPSFGDHVHDSFRAKFAPKTSLAGDVVVTTKGTVGRVALMREHHPQFVYSPQVCFFRCLADGGVLPQWLYYWFKGPEFVSQALGVQGQTDMAPYINLADMRGLIITVPQPPVQRAIAGVLGALDDKIESNRRIARLLEDEARTVFAHQFDASPQSDGVALSELVDVNPNRQLRAGTASTYVGMADLPTDNALVERWETREAGSGQRFINGDVLVARITPCLENGKTALVDFLPEGETAWGSTEYIVFSARPGVSKEWVYCLARSDAFVEFAVRNMTGSSGRQRCPATAFDQYFLAPPDRQLLHEFGERFGAPFRRMGKARDENRALATLRDALLPELLSGRLRVCDAETLVVEAV
jgi:type I restriction enzyme S subunit